MLGDEILKQRIGLHLSTSELARLTNTTENLIFRLETHDQKFITEENFNKLNQVLHLEEYREYIYTSTGVLLGKMLKEARLRLGYRQIDVAKMAGYRGCSKISMLENGTYSKINESTFLKLQIPLSLNREDFEPFIEKNHNIRGAIKQINQKRIQELVSLKRKRLHLSKKELGNLSALARETVNKVENKNSPIYISTLIKLMYELKFSKEEVLECIPDLKEEDLEYFNPKVKEKINVKKKPIS